MGVIRLLYMCYLKCRKRNHHDLGVIPNAGMDLSYVLSDISQTDPGKND